MQEIKIFISSPGDVGPERGLTQTVIERLQGDYWNFVRLEPVLWEYEATRAVAHFNEEIIAPADCDIVLAFLWTRLGSRMPPQFVRADGSRHESGTEWEIVTALEAHGQHGRPDVMVYRRFEQGPLPDEADAIRRAEAVSQRAKLDRFWKEHFLNPDGTIRRAYVSFKERKDLAPRLTEQLRRLIHRRLPASVPAYEVFRPEPLPPGSPFLGLHAFGFEDSPLFFGRSRAVAAIARQLRARAAREDGGAFVLILGGSGSGKSSLARAGVTARLTVPDTVSGVDAWRLADLHPSSAGQTPLDVLAGTLLTALPELAGQALADQPLDAAALAAKMADPEWLVLLDGPLHAALHSAARAGGEGETARLFLVVDQLEELFTDKTITEAQRGTFVRALAFLAGTRAVWIVATMRSEFFARAIELPALRLLMRGEGSYTLLPPDAGEINQIVRYPAAAANLHFERHPQTGEGLADAIHAEATHDTRALPLLEFLLQDLYEHKDANNVLLWRRYEDVGRLAGALVSHADAALKALRDDTERTALDLIFLALVTIDDREQAIPTRNRAPRAVLERLPGGARVLEVFIGARLFVADAEAAVPVVSLAHEALLAHWPYLQEFVNKHAGLLRSRRRLADLCNRWQTRADLDPKGADKLLLEEGSLAEAQEVVRFGPPDLTEGEREFVGRSTLKAQKRLRRLRAAVAVFAVLAVAASVAGLVARRQQRIATEQREIAQTREAEALEANRKTRAQIHQACLSDLAAARNLTSKGNWREALSYVRRAQTYDDPGSRLADAWLWTRVVYGQGDRDCLPQGLPRYEGKIREVAFSPDRTRLVIFPDGAAAQQWNLVTGKPIGELPRYEKDIERAVYSPDGTRILTVEDHAVRQREASTGAAVGQPLPHDEMVVCAVYSPDGTRLVTGCYDGTARQWDAATGKLIGEPLRDERDPETADSGDYGVIRAAYSPDGTRIVTACRQNARQWDAATGKPVGKPLLHKDGVTSAVYSPDGLCILTGCGNGTARQWDALTGEPIGDFMDHQHIVNDAVYSPDGRRIVVRCEEEIVQQWDAITGKSIGEPLPHEAEVAGAAYSPDGTHILTVCRDGTIWRWETATSQPCGEPFRHEREVRSAVYSPDGARVLTASGDETARQWDALTGKAIGEPLRQKAQLFSAAYDTVGARVLTVCANGSVQQWEAATGKPIGEPLRYAQHLFSAAYNPDGTRIVTTSVDDRTTAFDPVAWQWDAATGKLTGEPMRHKEACHSASYSPDGTRVVTLCGDGAAYQWDALTGKPIGEPLRREGLAIFSVAYSPDGARIVTACNDKTAWQWDAATGKLIGGPLRHEKEVDRAVYSSDGTRIVTACKDEAAWQWDAATGQPLGGPLYDGDIDSTSAVYSPDGTRIVTVGNDRTARQWDCSFPATPPPPWLDDLVQALTGLRFDDHGELQRLTLAERLALRAALQSQLRAAPSGPDGWRQLALWALTPPGRRSAYTPNSKQSTVDIATRELNSFQQEGIEAAVRLVPDLPLAHLLLAIFEENPVRADFLRRYELAHLPPTDMFSHAAVAATFRNEKQPLLALRALEETRLTAPPPAPWLASLALTRWMAGDRDGAVRDSQRLISVDSDYANAAKVSAAVMLPDDDKAALLAAITETLRRHPELAPKPGR